MALGSSAPEILLSVIEIVGNGFRAGDLGPGTIVGSAAFNLFCITGVCVIAVPTGTTRRIETFNVCHYLFIYLFIYLFKQERVKSDVNTTGCCKDTVSHTEVLIGAKMYDLE